MIKRERASLIIATKVGYAGGADPENLRRQFDEIRRRLGLDTVDILYLHRFDPHTDLARATEWFAGMRVAGLVRHVGVSNLAAWQVMKAGGGQAIDIVQPMFNLVKRQAEVEILPMCAD